MNVFFSDHFDVKPKDIEKYGAFNISLISDLPLFIDPFLLFNSKKKEYKELHEKIIDYLVFLKNKSTSSVLDKGALKAWYLFQEVQQNWFGFSLGDNKGSGLGMDFAKALNENLGRIFKKFGQEDVTKSSHLEKLCLIKEGVGKDNISDFATNLIKEFLLEYTQIFTAKYVREDLRGEFRVPKTRFNYDTESWEEGTFVLPKFKNDFVLLTPKELLTKDDTWINKSDLLNDFDKIPYSIPDEQLRHQINNYFINKLKTDPKQRKEPTKKEKEEAVFSTIQEFPQLIDFYIKYKEEHGDQAESISSEKVTFSQEVYIENVQIFTDKLKETDFYKQPEENSFDEANKKILILKKFIENNDGYKLFYDKKGKVITREADLQLLFKLTCHDSMFDINREVNNGRGAVDFTISKGKKDKTLVEFKLAKNSKLKQNLLKQVEIYQEANETDLSYKVIIYFSADEYDRVIEILNETELADKKNIILIDGRKDNKPSASNVKV